MARYSKVLRPVVATVTAAALAVGGALVGFGAASTQERVVSTVVEGEEAAQIPADIAESADDFADVSGLLPEVPTPAEARVGVDSEGEQARLDDYLSGLLAADDPELAAPALMTVAGLRPPDDPCAPTDGVPEEGCPKGLAGTILALRDGPRPPLRIVHVAPVVAGLALGEHCPLHPDSPFTIAVVTTEPVEARLRYWSADSGSMDGETGWQSTNPVDRDAWLEELDLRTIDDPSWPTVVTCVELYEPVPAGAQLEAHVEVWSASGASTYRRFSFGADGVVPPSARIFTTTDDLVHALVPHRPGEAVVTIPHVARPGSSPDCTATPMPDDGLIREIGVPLVRTLTPAEMRLLGVAAGYSERSLTTWAVDEGLDVLVCVQVRRMDGSEVYAASALVRTRDRLSPEVDIWSSGASDGTGSWEVEGYLANGERCGLLRLTEGETWRTNDPPAGFCRLAALPGTSGARRAAPLPVSSGVLGTYAIGIRAVTAVEGDFVALRTIDLDAMAPCVSRCESPADSYHVIDAPLDSDGGFVFVIARIRWTQGNSNGALVTTVSNVADTFTPTTPFPRLDVVGAGLTETIMFNDISAAPEAAIVIRADREAYATVRLIAAPGSGAFCAAPGAIVEQVVSLGPVDGEWTTPATVTFSGLCRGAGYRALVFLAAGSQLSVWGADAQTAHVPGDAWVGGDVPRGTVYTSPLPGEVRLTYHLLDSRPEGSTPPMDGAAVTVRLEGADLVGPARRTCLAVDGTAAVSRDVAVLLSDRMHLSGEIRVVRDCSSGAASPAVYPMTFAADLSLAQLRANPDGVVIDLVETAPRPLDPYVGALHARLRITLLAVGG